MEKQVNILINDDGKSINIIILKKEFILIYDF